MVVNCTSIDADMKYTIVDSRISGVYCGLPLPPVIDVDGPDAGASIMGTLLDAEDGSVCDELGDNVDWTVVGRC